LHIGPEDQVGVTFPDFKLMLLRCIYRTADYLKDVGRGAAMSVLHSDGNAEDDRRSEFSSGARWNGRDEPAVRQAARADLHRLEQTRKSATRADGVHQIALREDHRIARSQVRGDDRERDAKVFELARIENALDQVGKSLVACQAEAGDPPAGNVPEAQCAACFNDARQRRSAGVGSSENAANAGSRDVRDRDLVLFEYLQHAEMREATGESAAEGESNPCPGGQGGCTIVQGLPRSVPMPRHDRSFAAGTFSTYGSRVLLWEYFCTAMETAQRFAKIEVRRLDSTFLLVQYPLCTIVSDGTVRDSHSRQDVTLRGPRVEDAFKAWVGQPVVLQVALGDIKVPLRGKLLKDGEETVRMRIGEGWDVDIYKAMILAVEEDSMVLLPA
jgi:hypothetical protein